MKRNVYAIGFVVFILVMIAFFITNIFFRNVNYYETSMGLNAFLLPFLFAAGAYYSVTTFSRWKKVISFKEVYGRAFIPMFTACFLSLSSIFVYITYVDTDTKDLLNHQFIERYKNSLEEEYTTGKKVIKPNTPEMEELEDKYAEAKIRLQHKIDKNEDMFSLRYFGYVFAVYCAFFLILSVFFGSFFRTKTVG
ncbi:MAG: DUF4199 domain-containing protein [Flavobacteriales bacterium]|nr:MAG: DUF4199 domain-containing protein [Flavobacteriales bacterium]